MSIYQNPKIKALNEVSIGDCGSNFRVDLTSERGGHDIRLKISRKSGSNYKHGSSVQILRNPDPMYYSDIRRDSKINYSKESEDLIPLAIGFVTIYRFFMIEYVNRISFGGNYDEILNYISDEWVSFYNTFKRASEGQIRDYANNCVDERMKRESMK